MIFVVLCWLDRDTGHEDAGPGSREAQWTVKLNRRRAGSKRAGILHILSLHYILHSDKYIQTTTNL